MTDTTQLAADAATVTDIDATAPNPAPAPQEPAPEPQVEPDATPEPQDGDPPPRAAPEPEPKPKKSPIAQLQGRVGHLTKLAAEKDAALLEAQRQMQALQQLIEAGGQDPNAAPAQPTLPQPGTDAFRQAVAQEAQRVAAQTAFTTECNKVFEQGVKTHGDTFKEAIANLNMMGIVGPQDDSFLEAALATDAPDAVLNHLGSDLDEAQHIASLPPIRKAAEMVKLAARLASPAVAAAPQRTSTAPAPIKPIGGAAKATNDVYEPGLSMDEYVRRRVAQGAAYARQAKA